jgi:hypothetical protein
MSFCPVTPPDVTPVSANDAALELPGQAGMVAVRALLRAIAGASGVGGMIESVAHDPLFEFDLEQVDVARWLDISQAGTRAVRRQWRAS